MGKLIFITGGVRSGKSAFAEKYAVELYEKYDKQSLVYIASGVAVDEEMTQRIRRHQLDREKSKVHWHTVEIKDDIFVDEKFCHQQTVILWDCITTWLTNILFKTEHLKGEQRMNEIKSYIGQLKAQIVAWKNQNVMVLAVSNELLDEQCSSYDEVNLYRYLLGNLHQWFVTMSDEAFELDYGETIRWK